MERVPVSLGRDGALRVSQNSKPAQKFLKSTFETPSPKIKTRHIAIAEVGFLATKVLRQPPRRRPRALPARNQSHAPFGYALAQPVGRGLGLRRAAAATGAEERAALRFIPAFETALRHPAERSPPVAARC